MFTEIETERLLIRPIKIDDKGFIFDLLNTQGWLQFIGDRKVRDDIDAEKYIRNILDNKNFFYGVFELKATKQQVGIITFLYRDSQKSPDIGFAMLPKFDKKGYAFEATKKYLDEIIDNKNTSKIIAITKPDNVNSIKLIEKLGLQYEHKFVEKSEVLHLYAMIPNNNE